MISSASVCIVGRGRLGTALAAALPGAAHVAARAQDGALDDAFRTLPAQGRTFVFAVADDHVAAVAARFAARVAPGDVALHTSGALAADASGPLGALAGRGAHVGALHVLRAVARGTADDLSGAPATVAGDESARASARELAHAVGLDAFAGPDGGDDRALYHAAAALVAGGGVALVDAALGLCAAAGLDRVRARMALAELLASTARNLATSAPADALTGPFARGDASTVAAHLRVVGRAGAAELYAAVGRHLLEIQGARLGPDAVARLRALLGGG